MISAAPRLAPVLVLLALGAIPAPADVITTTDGLVLEGEVARDAQGNYVLTRGEETAVLEAGRVAKHVEGAGPRTKLTRRAATLGPKDGVGWYRLALEAEAAGLPDLAREALERVVAAEPDHTAARRALGHEKVDDAWVTEAVARRRRGLVLFEGRWMLPAEVETTVRGTRSTPLIRPPGDEARTRTVIRTYATGEEMLRHAAALALAETARSQRLRALLGTLYDGDPTVRVASAQLLGELGDEVALRPLILSGARDVDPAVRRECVLAAASFGHDDTAIPYVRALGSENPQLVANAAAALGALGDQRAFGYIVKRISSHGASTRNFVAFTNQVSYVRDYDVEIAQASNIANPDVATIQEGVILDVKVLDAHYEKTWIETALVGAASQLAGRPFANRGEVLAWYAEHAETLPAFPERGPPARKRGRVIGAPMTR